MVPKPAKPQAFNRYAYALNNPLKYIDPTGHFASDEELAKYLGLTLKELYESNFWKNMDDAFKRMITSKQFDFGAILGTKFSNGEDQYYMLALNSKDGLLAFWDVNNNRPWGVNFLLPRLAEANSWSLFENNTVRGLGDYSQSAFYKGSYISTPKLRKGWDGPGNSNFYLNAAQNVDGGRIALDILGVTFGTAVVIIGGAADVADPEPLTKAGIAAGIGALAVSIIDTIHNAATGGWVTGVTPTIDPYLAPDATSIWAYPQN
jgi:hypothetical protein